MTKLKNALIIFSSLLFFGIFLPQANAAALYFSPSSANFPIDKTFKITLYVSSPEQALNAIQATINFPADILEATGYEKENSIINLWIQEPFISNKDGVIKLEGISLNPGFMGNQGKFITIIFKAKILGSASLVISPASVLANDGFGTEILSQISTARLAIVAPPVPPAPPTFPEEKPIIMPLSKPSPPPTAPLPLLPLPDTTPPLPFEITQDNGNDPTNPRPILYFQTEDKDSEVAFYNIKIDNRDKFPIYAKSVAENPFIMPLQAPGTHRVIIEATDRAGNIAIAKTNVIIKPIKTPKILTITEKMTPHDTLVLTGYTLPHTDILIYIQKEKGGLSQKKVKSTTKGEWLYTHSGLDEGTYKIWVKAQDQRKALSQDSNQYTLVVKMLFLEKIKQILSIVWLDIIIVIILFISLILLFKK